MKLLSLLVIGFLYTVQSLCAQGLLIFKANPFEQDSRASLMEYSTVKKFPTVYNVVTRSGEPQRIVSGLVIREIVYSEIECPVNLVSQADAARLVTNIAGLSSVLEKWPAARKYLQSHLTANKAALDQMKKGSVLVNGTWQTAQAYNDSVAATRKQQEAAREKQMAEDRIAAEKAAEAAPAKAAELQKKLTLLKEDFAKRYSSAGDLTNINNVTFKLTRKLPRDGFAELYSLGPYVFQGLAGREITVIVSYSVSLLNNQYVSLWVRRKGDIDVLTVGGATERVPLFIEATALDIMELGQLASLRAQIEKTTRDLQGVKAVLDGAALQRELRMGDPR